MGLISVAVLSSAPSFMRRRISVGAEYQTVAQIVLDSGDDSEIREALSECVAAVVSAIRAALEQTPPELAADISDRGIVLAGGGALLRNLDKRIREETGLPVCIAEDPLCSVVLGAARLLNDFRLLRRVAVDCALGLPRLAALSRACNRHMNVPCST